MEVLLVFLLGVIIFGAFGFWNYRRGKKRQALLAAWAEARNWQHAKTDYSLRQRWNSTPFTAGPGNSPRVADVMWGPVTASKGASPPGDDLLFLLHGDQRVRRQ